ncbi:FMN-binding glutamate synthase family protein [Mobilicoccus caccae]|uniref:FMN-binding glutamate synthase family protein n=2 Tax=Mobilicoccus caccae TaxID=1859295 RepID=A0ABQ6IQ97_9MICO|nr:FMN-binding glutamate synthase family protein [Mobilicoccus caccae]
MVLKGVNNRWCRGRRPLDRGAGTDRDGGRTDGSIGHALTLAPAPGGRELSDGCTLLPMSAKKSLLWSASAGLAGITGLAAHDVLQKKHSLLRAFPVVGHGRYFVETIGPELRQYIVASNDEERPFSRDQRSYIYSAAKGVNTYFGFGTDNDIEHLEGYPVIKHRTFTGDAPDTAAAHGSHDDATLPCAKVLGAARGRRKAFRPHSIVNVSAMSYGSLSAQAIRALNGGAAAAGCLHNTGEGGLSDHHRQGGDLILQIGTAYFGCRDSDGRFDLDKLVALTESAPVRAIEVKLSQGAKPGLGGVLPAAKVTPEIARIRGIPEGEDCISPSRHTAFHDVDSMLDWVELVADATGLPVGIKSAVGDMTFWEHLAEQMTGGDRGVDFVTVDGGEGGTGAAPLVFSDSVSMPFRAGFTRVYSVFARAGLTDRIVFVGSGKLGLPDNAMVAFALGADMLNVAREAMLAIGCLQTQKCHTGHCPTGVATQNRWLARSLDPELKAGRTASYISTLRRDLLKVAEATGVLHPALIDCDDIEIFFGQSSSRSLRDVAGYEAGWGQPSRADRDELARIMAELGDESPAPAQIPTGEDAQQEA